MRDVVALVKRERLAGRPPVTSGGVVAQVWRGGRGRQVQVARLLAGTEVAAIDDSLGRRAGMLLARSGQSDAIDASVVCLAADGDDILTLRPRRPARTRRSRRDPRRPHPRIGQSGSRACRPPGR